jgi:hypothetical protein
MLSHRFRNTRSAAIVLAAATFGIFGIGAASAPSAHAGSTSIFIAYSGHNFGGTKKELSGCGVHNMPYAVGSYAWVAEGQSGNMYNCKNAGCNINFTLSSSESGTDKNGVGWQSVQIIC